MTSLHRPFAEVIGDPIEHSKSPSIHGFWLNALGIEAEYGARRVTRADLSAYLEESRGNPAWRGCNVTMPLKLDALEAADEASDVAVAAGAANLLLPNQHRLVADNTDVGAIATLLKDIGKASVTVLGNGGAARGALVALRMIGAGDVGLQARDLAAAESLTAEFDLARPPASFLDPIFSAVLINATPLGMAGQACLNCDVGGMPSNGLVFDMVSAPAETELIVAAKARGLRTITGLAMLIEQAATSFAMLFGQDPPRYRDGELMLLLRA